MDERADDGRFDPFAGRPFFLVGMVHLPPLPGSPGWDPAAGMAGVLAAALRDARALLEGGVDGLLVENFGDGPFLVGPVRPETVAALAVVAAKLVKLAERLRPGEVVPLGVNVLRNDPLAAVGVAAATGASFLRVNVHAGVYDTDQGRIEGKAGETLRARARLGLAGRLAVWADARVKHARLVAPFASLEEEVSTLVGRAGADAVVLTGPATGTPVDLDELRAVAAMNLPVPVVVGSGVDEFNVERLAGLADGAIVGTWLKKEGRVDRPVDPERVARLVERANRQRGA
ncbi:MAG: BtpA/SgcQ family protein [Promethearchaeota archaeon]